MLLLYQNTLQEPELLLINPNDSLICLGYPFLINCKVDKNKIKFYFLKSICWVWFFLRWFFAVIFLLFTPLKINTTLIEIWILENESIVLFRWHNLFFLAKSKGNFFYQVLKFAYKNSIYFTGKKFVMRFRKNGNPDQKVPLLNCLHLVMFFYIYSFFLTIFFLKIKWFLLLLSRKWSFFTMLPNNLVIILFLCTIVLCLPIIITVCFWPSLKNTLHKLKVITGYKQTFDVIFCLIYFWWFYMWLVALLYTWIPVAFEVFEVAFEVFENFLKVIIILLKIICLLISIAYFTIAERKVMASIQRRKGPNIVGFWGLLQPLADGLKLLIKEMIIPTKANNLLFIFAPIIILTLSLVSWSVIPMGIFETNFSTQAQNNNDGNEKMILFSLIAFVANVKSGVLFLLAISSLNVYGIIISGWASNSKYAFLGALRSAAQMISYEVSIGLVVLPVILLAGSLNLTEIVYVQSVVGWFIFPLLPCGIIFFISMLAETNRAPFDLPEAEAELVAGYNVEYSSIIFAMFFLAEYSNMLLMSTLITLLFFGGWLPGFWFLEWIYAPLLFSIKIIIFCFFFILVRASFPRYRYDQLMDIGWKLFLPITTGFLLFVVGFLSFTDSLIIVDKFLQI